MVPNKNQKAKYWIHIIILIALPKPFFKRVVYSTTLHISTMKLWRSLFFLLTAAEAFLPPTVTTRRHSVLLFMSTEVSVKEITSNADERMGKSVDSVKTNLSTIRTGRASSNMLDRVKVEYYGTIFCFVKVL